MLAVASCARGLCVVQMRNVPRNRLVYTQVLLITRQPQLTEMWYMQLPARILRISANTVQRLKNRVRPVHRQVNKANSGVQVQDVQQQQRQQQQEQHVEGAPPQTGRCH